MTSAVQLASSVSTCARRTLTVTPLLALVLPGRSHFTYAGTDRFFNRHVPFPALTYLLYISSLIALYLYGLQELNMPQKPGYKLLGKAC